jgi:hypothetical protein
VPIFAVALMKSGPSLLTEPYRKHEHAKMGDRTKFLERAPRSSRISRPVRLAAGHRGSWRVLGVSLRPQAKSS